MIIMPEENNEQEPEKIKKSLNPRVYDPERHCGATSKRTGEPCKYLKGHRTNHPGEGRCYLHGGRSTGAKTAEGIKNNRNRKTHGLYSTVLSKKEKEQLEKAQDIGHGEILAETFYVTHAKLSNIIDGGGELRGQSKILFQACEILVEQGEITSEFAEDVRLRLMNLDPQQMNQLFVATIPLADAAVRLADVGNIRLQLSILQPLIIDILRISGEKVVKEMILSAIQQMKLDAGLPVEELERYLEEAQEIEDARIEENNSEDEDEDEDEELLTEGKTNDVSRLNREEKELFNREEDYDDKEDYWF